MESVLITGAAGFIGSHLTERFLKEGFAVLGVDNFLTGRESNLKGVQSNPHFRFEKADVALQKDFKNPFGGKFRYVMHFACPASPIDFDVLAEEILEVDSKGTLNMLQLAKANGSTFFMASTSEVYGDPLIHPQKEDYWGNANSYGPRACYDETKRFSEACTYVYRNKYKLDTRIVRIFNTYGPRMRLNDGRIVPTLCAQALQGESLTIHGDGQQTRSFCYVDDLVDGIYRLARSNFQEPVNIGNPHEYTVMEFAEAIGRVLGKNLVMKNVPARPDDPRRRRPDISRAKAVLNWEPRVSLDDGLRRTLEAFQAEL
jgi:dTDP-glucose 4,6-dehydratase